MQSYFFIVSIDLNKKVLNKKELNKDLNKKENKR